jgi:outer membrane protein TolC
MRRDTALPGVGLRAARQLTRLLTVLLIMPTGSLALASVGHNSDQPLPLRVVVDLALADNPGLAELQARARALAAVPAQKGALPDPRLSLNAMNLPLDSFDLSQEPMTQLQIGFSQTLPYPGKLSLSAAAAEHERDAAHWQVEEMRLKLVRDVKTVWWNLYYLDRALEIIEHTRDLLRQLVEVAQTKYKVGKGLQQDVLLAQLELSKLLDQAFQLQGSRRNQAIKLNALMNKATDSAITLPGKRSLKPVAIEKEHRDLQKLAFETRPLLAARKSLMDAARARVGLAKKDYFPDFKLGATYGYRGGENPDGGARSDFLSLMFSMNLPLYSANRQDKAVDQRTSQLLQQRYKLDEAQEKVQAEVSRAVSDYRQAYDQMRLLEGGIIPQASQTVASMLAAYQVNKVDFLNLVQAQITLFNYETRYWSALSQTRQSLARLTAAVGGELPAGMVEIVQE